MRVLFITGRSDLPERHVIAGLAAEGWSVRVLGDFDDETRRFFEERDVAIEPLHVHSRLDWRAIVQIRRAARAWKPNVVQCFTSRGLTCAILSGLPPGAKLVAYRGAVGGVSRWDPSARFGVLHPRVDAVWCVSKSIARALAAGGLPERKLWAIYKGHDPGWYRGRGRQRAREGGEFVAGFIGNMRPVKGAHVLLEALRRVPPNLPLRVVLVGEILDRRVKRLLGEPEIARRIERHGFVPRAFEWIPTFDLLVVPSLEGEGLSKAALEAMAQRVPVLASASGGLAEIIEDRVTGRLVAPGDSEALARALIEMARDRDACRAYAEAAYRRVEYEFHISRTIRELASLYSSLCPEAR